MVVSIEAVHWGVVVVVKTLRTVAAPVSVEIEIEVAVLVTEVTVLVTEDEVEVEVTANVVVTVVVLVEDVVDDITSKCATALLRLPQ